MVPKTCIGEKTVSSITSTGKTGHPHIGDYLLYGAKINSKWNLTPVRMSINKKTKCW
jgi:hypothetical protein